MQNEITNNKRETAKDLRSSMSLAPSINNLKRILLEINIIEKKTETHVQQKQSYINTELQILVYKRSIII